MSDIGITRDELSKPLKDELDGHYALSSDSTNKGHIQIATQEEAIAGADDAKAITPKTLNETLAEKVESQITPAFITNTVMSSTEMISALGNKANKTDLQALSSYVNTLSKSEDLAKIKINMIDLAINLETLKASVLTGVSSNIFVETFQDSNDINITHGVYDSSTKKVYLL